MVPVPQRLRKIVKRLSNTKWEQVVHSAHCGIATSIDASSSQRKR